MMTFVLTEAGERWEDVEGAEHRSDFINQAGLSRRGQIKSSHSFVEGRQVAEDRSRVLLHHVIQLPRDRNETSCRHFQKAWPFYLVVPSPACELESVPDVERASLGKEARV
jgi:hypothetical protein